MIGYHFTGKTLRNGHPIPPIGEWLEHEGKIVPCTSGLHASEHPFDGLQYAPGAMLHLVELDGDLRSHGDPVDKHVGRRRRILRSIDATGLLCEFARWCALQVIHLWDAPEVVREYLETGDENLSSSAASAAWEASRAARASREAVWETAWEARAAAWAAARASAAGASARKIQREKFKSMVDAAFEFER